MDDLLVTGPDIECLQQFKTQMLTVFEMTNLGLLSYFLGMEVKQSTRQIILHQSKYAKDLLKKFPLDTSKPITIHMIVRCKLSKNDGSKDAIDLTFRSIIGSLLYLFATRLDIMLATCLLSRFMQNPSLKAF